MNDEKKIDKLIRTIRALKAKAESTNSEAEAAAFAAKAAELMAAYGLEEAQLSVEEQSGVEHLEEEQNWSSPSRRGLAIAVCRLYMVRPILSGIVKGGWILIGRKHNITMAIEMTDYLVKTTTRLSTRWRRENEATSSQMIDFRKGCFDRLQERINEMRRAQEQAAAPQWTPTGNPQNLPALYRQESTLLDTYMSKHWPNLRRGRRTTIRMGGAAAHGRAAGDGISLSRQVSGGGSGAMLIGKR